MGTQEILQNCTLLPHGSRWALRAPSRPRIQHLTLWHIPSFQMRSQTFSVLLKSLLKPNCFEQRLLSPSQMRNLKMLGEGEPSPLPHHLSSPPFPRQKHLALLWHMSTSVALDTPPLGWLGLDAPSLSDLLSQLLLRALGFCLHFP